MEHYVFGREYTCAAVYMLASALVKSKRDTIGNWSFEGDTTHDVPLACVLHVCHSGYILDCKAVSGPKSSLYNIPHPYSNQNLSFCFCCALMSILCNTTFLTSQYGFEPGNCFISAQSWSARSKMDRSYIFLSTVTV